MLKTFKEYLGGIRLGYHDNVKPMADLGDKAPRGMAGRDSRGVGLHANKNPRIPRKPGQKAGSKKHSDLYTDENPKGTIHGLKFATVKDAEASVRKIKSSGKAHAHKIQAAIAMEQRAKAAGKKSAAAVYRRYINKMKKKTKKMKEATEQLSLVLEQLQGQGYEKGNRIVNGRT